MVRRAYYSAMTQQPQDQVGVGLGAGESQYPHRVLVLFAHPAVQKSRVNRRMAAAIQDLPGVTFHDLYEAYPDLHINVRREQELLLAHDIIVWQHPFYWYSSPAILKEWQDLVLEYGFAYGAGGRALAGKMVLTATTTGGPPESYHAEGLNHYSVREFLRPFEQTARLCHMEYLPPFLVQGTLGSELPEDVSRSCETYRSVILALRDGRVDWPQLRAQATASENLGWIRPQSKTGGER